MQALSKALLELRAQMTSHAEQQIVANAAQKEEALNVQQIVDRQTKEIKARLKEQNEELQGLKENIKAGKARERALKDELENLNGELQRNLKSQSKKQSERDALEEQLEELKQKVKRLSSGLQGQSEGEIKGPTVEALQKKIRKLETELDRRIVLEPVEKKHTVKDDKSNKEELVRWEEGKKWQAKMEKVRNLLKEKEKETESVSKQLATLKELYARLEQEKLGLQKKLKSRGVTADQVVGMRTLEVEELKKRNSELEQQIEMIKQQQALPRDAAMEDMNIRNRYLEERVHSLENQLAKEPPSRPSDKSGVSSIQMRSSPQDLLSEVTRDSEDVSKEQLPHPQGDQVDTVDPCQLPRVMSNTAYKAEEWKEENDMAGTDGKPAKRTEEKNMEAFAWKQYSAELLQGKEGIVKDKAEKPEAHLCISVETKHHKEQELSIRCAEQEQSQTSPQQEAAETELYVAMAETIQGSSMSQNGKEGASKQSHDSEHGQVSALEVDGISEGAVIMTGQLLDMKPHGDQDGTDDRDLQNSVNGHSDSEPTTAYSELLSGAVTMDGNKHWRRTRIKPHKTSGRGSGTPSQKEQELQKEILKISSENLELRFQLEQANRDLPRLKDQVSDLKEMCDALKKEKAEVLKKLGHIRGSGRSGKTVPELEKTIALMKKVVEKVQKENESLKKNSSSATPEHLASLEREHEKLKTEYERLKEKIQLTSKLESKTKAMEKIVMENERLRRDIKKESEAAEKLRVEKVSLEVRSEKLKTELEELNQKLLLAQSKAPNIDGGDSKAWKSTVVTRLFENKLKELESEINKKNASLTELKLQLAEAHEKAQTAQYNIIQLKEQVELLRNVPIEATSDEGLAKEFQSLRLAKLQLERERNHLLHEVQKYKEQFGTTTDGPGYKDLQAQMKAANAEKARLQDEVRRMTKELANFDPTFFEELEDLKFNYNMEVKKNIILEEELKKLSERFGVEVEIPSDGSLS